MLADDDPGFGITLPARAGQDLEQMLAELDGVVVGHRALIGEAADVIQSVGGRQEAIGTLGIGGSLGEARIVAWEEASEDRVGLVEGAGVGTAEFAPKAILEDAPEALNAALRLRGRRGNPADAQLLERPAKLRGRSAQAAELLGEGRERPSSTGENTVAVAIEGDRAAMSADQVPQDRQVSDRVFLRPEESRRDLVRGVIDAPVKDEAWAAAFEPVMVTGVELHEQPFLRHAVPAAAMAGRSPRMRAGEAGVP
jgi:hypothetical protein